MSSWLLKKLIAMVKCPASARSLKLEKLVSIFKTLKSIYPSPTLHDCIDGNDENPVLLDQTQL